MSKGMRLGREVEGMESVGSPWDGGDPVGWGKYLLERASSCLKRCGFASFRGDSSPPTLRGPIDTSQSGNKQMATSASPLHPADVIPCRFPRLHDLPTRDILVSTTSYLSCHPQAWSTLDVDLAQRDLVRTEILPELSSSAGLTPTRHTSLVHRRDNLHIPRPPWPVLIYPELT